MSVILVIPTCALTALRFASCLTTNLAAEESPQSAIPILGWHSIPGDYVSEERFAEMAAAGFTHSLMGYDPETTGRALDAAQRAGIQLFVSAPPHDDNLPAGVKRWKDHPALAGWTLRDEPNAADFAGLAAWADAIRAIDPDHFCYVNLFPNYANEQQLGTKTYEEHVSRYLDVFRPEVLSFDHYPVLRTDAGDVLRPNWYENLEIIRRAARERKIPFWAFTLAVPHGPYPLPTEAHLRVQLYSDLAYGAKGLQYFTYWTPVDAHWNFHDGPITADGKQTATYALAQKVNREIAILSLLLREADFDRLGHLPPLPAGTTAFAPDEWIAAAEGEDCLLATGTRPGTDGRLTLVVNRHLTEPRTLRLTLREGVCLAVCDRSVGKFGEPQPGPEITLTLELGDGQLVQLTRP